MNFDRFISIERKLGVRRTIVLMITLWMTWRSYTWATEYAAAVLAAGKAEWASAGALIAAVTAPISYLLKAVLEQYSDSKKEVL